MATRFAIEAVFKGIDKFSAPVARMTTKMDRFSRGLRKGMTGIAKSTKRVARGMRNMSLTMGSLAFLGGYALKGLLGPAVKFEHAMAGVNAVMRGTYKTHMPMLAKKAKELGRSTVFTASEVAGAMENLARAGLDPGEIVSAIDPILNAAAAQGSDIEGTANVIVSTMKGFRKGFDETTRSADVMAYLSSKTKTTIASLGEGMSKVAPVAERLGLGFDDVAIAVASLQDVGIEASMSGTQLRTMLTKLTKLTPKATKKFKDLGIQISKNGEMLQLPELLKNIVKGFQGAGSMEKVGDIAEAVGLRGAIAANLLAASWEDAGGGFQELLQGVATEADGAAKKMADLRQNSLMGNIIRMKSAWEGFRIDIGTGQIPALNRLTETITGWLTNEDNIAAVANSLNSAVEGLEHFWAVNGTGIKDLGRMTWESVKVMAQLAGYVANEVGDMTTDWSPVAAGRALLGTTDIDPTMDARAQYYEKHSKFPEVFSLEAEANRQHVMKGEIVVQVAPGLEINSTESTGDLKIRPFKKPLSLSPVGTFGWNMVPE